MATRLTSKTVASEPPPKNGWRRQSRPSNEGNKGHRGSPIRHARQMTPAVSPPITARVA